MTTTSTSRGRIAGRQIVVGSPAARPAVRLPRAHPARPAAPGAISAVKSCAVGAPEPRSPWLALKVAAVSVLAVVGGAVSVAQFVGGATAPDPAVQYVAGDPAWAHVTQP